MSIKLLIYFLFFFSSVCATSMVYNFRIAQVTKQPIFEDVDNKKTIIPLFFDQYQKKYHGDISQNFVGGLGAFIYEFAQCYFRTDFAFSHIHEKTENVTTYSGTKTDDILFTFGGKIINSSKSPLSLSVLLGLPTHALLRLQHADFGFAQVGAGLQFDGSYKFPQEQTLVYGVRYIHFFSRGARDVQNIHYSFTVGNEAGLLLAYKKGWNKHGIEAGYTERFQFGANCLPHFDDILKKTDYTRSSFYVVYKYKFLSGAVAHRFLCNIGYGFDTSPKRYGNKNIALFWAAWNVNF